jgi:hypothetical protein
VDIGVWSLPFVTINGRRHGRNVDIGRLDLTTGLKFNNFGYISRGDKVPEVMIIDLNLSNTGFIANEASRQVSCKRGSRIPVIMLP